MTAEEWDTIALLLHRGFKWREPFGEAHEVAYRTLLRGYEAKQILMVLDALVARGQVFGPTPGEIVAEIRSDPSKPTFEEAYALIYGRGGILRARPPRGPYADAAEMARAERAAQKARAAECHPLVGHFCERMGYDRLAGLDLNDEEYGDLRRRELGGAWAQHVEAFDGREVRALVSGQRDGLARLDPLAAIQRPVVAEIGSGR